MQNTSKTTQKKGKTSTKKRRMRLPNGYGSVHLIKDGKTRRKPWRARIPSHLVLDKDAGTCTQKYINLGCFETEQEAIDAIETYLNKKYNETHKVVVKTIFPHTEQAGATKQMAMSFASNPMLFVTVTLLPHRKHFPVVHTSLCLKHPANKN